MDIQNFHVFFAYETVELKISTVKTGWPLRKELKPVDKNVIDNPLVPRGKIMFPLLLIKLGLMKLFVKALNKEGKYFEYLSNTFTGITLEKKF